MLTKVWRWSGVQEFWGSSLECSRGTGDRRLWTDGIHNKPVNWPNSMPKTPQTASLSLRTSPRHWTPKLEGNTVKIWFISNLLQSNQNDTIQRHILHHPNPLHSTQTYAMYYQRNHVEYSITIHILSRHYSDSQAPHYPALTFGCPLIGERVHRHIAVLWKNVWMKQQASTGCGPPFGVISILIMFLKCFSSVSIEVVVVMLINDQWQKPPNRQWKWPNRQLE